MIINADIHKIRKERCERSYLEFTKDSWKILEPMTPLESTWDHEYVCEYLQAAQQGQVKRLLINIPPRLGKSYKTHIQLVPWWWIKNPHTKFFNLSYTDLLSKPQNVKKRDLINSHWYQKNWGDKFSLKGDMNTQRKFENDHTGFSMASSVGGTVTGEGADVIIFDDPHNPRKAESDTEREGAVEFFKSTLQNRLNNLSEGIIIVVMQRLHDQDVSGHILASGAGYEHLCLPIEAHEKKIYSFPLSGKIYTREIGDILQPGRFTKENLDQLKKDMGSYSFAGQYEQDPTPKEGGTFKKWWWEYWQPEGYDLPPIPVVKVNDNGTKETIYKEAKVINQNGLNEYAQSWDMAFKGGKKNDLVAGEIWGKEKANKYLMHLDLQNRTFTQTLAAVRDMTINYPNAHRKFVEDKANGPAIIDSLHDEISGIIPINPGSDSKTARAESVTPQVESGNVYLPHPQLYDWVESFIEKAAKFPKVDHDDEIDAMVQILIQWKKDTFLII